MHPPYAQIVPLGAPVHLTYRIPDDLHLQIGMRVLIPFGERWTTGIAVGFEETSDLPDARIKSIGQCLDGYPLIEPHLLDLYRWMAGYYICSLSEVLSTALPAGIHFNSNQHLKLGDVHPVPIDLLSERQREIAAAIEERGSASVRQLERLLGKQGVQSAVYGLMRRGLLIAFQKMAGPRVRAKTERWIDLVPTDARWFDTELPALEKRAPRQAECIRTLRKTGTPQPVAHLTAQGISQAVLRALCERNIVRIIRREIRRDPYASADDSAPENLSPTPHQQTALEAIGRSITTGDFAVHLLHGVTGSGKTLIYIHAVARALKQGGGAIVMVPEIALTPQTVRRFRAHFGDGVAVLHSALSDAERYDAWRELREGKRRIAIGARSAIFAPVQNLRLIIVDEEHDGAYKQTDPAPRYSARDVAVKRAHLQQAVVVLGSATPSLESYHNATTGKFHLLCLPERIDNRPMPAVTVVDMRGEGGGLFSKPLREKMRDRLAKGERIILLQNRRGYAPSVQCTSCGAGIQCPHCQVALTYHSARRQMLCHYCGHTAPSPSACPSCKSTRLHMIGVGTQRVEETLAAQFEGARVLRMDVDTTGHKGAHASILERFSRGEADILLGTQMVAKGLDFPGVTLVGVISADTGIHLPDFRAGERTFQLLTQVGGRAGRGHLPGEVVIQTYRPDGEAVQCAQHHDFLAFARRELDARKTLDYPPFGRLVLLLFKGRDEHEVARTAGTCAEALRSATLPGLEVLGPVLAPIPRIQRTYRWQILLKSESPAKLNALARQALSLVSGSVTISIDVDPISML